MAVKLSTFDLSQYLVSDEAIAEYISQVLADGDTDKLLCAISYIAKAKGIAEIAKAAGVGRESLYKTLAAGNKPKFETISKLCAAIGVQLSAQPIHP